MADYKKLLVYQKARRLAQRMDAFYPRIRKRSRRLADQLERSVESIGDAIAEGRGRSTDKDFANFLTTAISSANEAEHQLQRALDRDILTEDEHRSLTDNVIEIRKMLIGLRKRVRGG
jgi:four helix bundle protein